MVKKDMAERSLTQKGIAALKQGNRAEAHRFLAAAAQKNPRDETAWLGLAACLDDPEKKRFCLQKVLALNPENQTARRMLARLEGSALSGQVIPAVPTSPPQPSTHVSLPQPPVPATESEQLPEMRLREEYFEKSPPARPSAGGKPPQRNRHRYILLSILIVLLLAAAGITGWLIFASDFQALALVQAIADKSAPIAPVPGSETPTAEAIAGENALPAGDPDFRQLHQFGKGIILDMALTPDGRQLILATSLGITLYDLEGWKDGNAPVMARHISTKKPATSLAVSPDGGRVAAIQERDAQDEQEIAVWSLADGKQLAKMDTTRRVQESQLVYDPVDARATAILFSPDGGQLFGRKSPLVVWNADDGSFLKSGTTGRSNGQMAFSPDGALTATCEDIEVVLWDTADQAVRAFPVSPAALAGGCGGLAFSQDSRWLASISAGGALDLWNLQSGERLDLLGSVLEGVENPPESTPESVLEDEEPSPESTLKGGTPSPESAQQSNGAAMGLSVAFSGDGASLAAGFEDRILFWQITAPAEPRLIRVLEPPEELLFTPDGGHLLTLGRGVVRLWRLADLSLAATLPDYEDYTGAAVSPDRQWIAAALPEGGVRLRRVQDMADVALLGESQSLTVPGFSPDNRRLAVLSNRLEVWLTSGGMEYALQPQGKFQAISPDWKSYLTLEEKTVRQFSLPEGKENWAKSFTESAQGAVYATGSVVIVAAGQNFHFLQAEDGRELYALPRGNTVDRVAYSPDGRYLVYARDREASIWQAADGVQLASFPLEDPAASFEFTNNSRFLAASDRSGLHLINPSNGSEDFFLDRCSSAMFSADSGKLVCYDSAGDRIRLLPVYQTSGHIELGSDVSSTAGLSNGVARWFFLPEKQQLLFLSYDGTARLWKIP